jgi:hypothetical protein
MSNLVAETIIRPGHVALGLAERLLADVKPEIFARKPVVGGKRVEANHPAFTYGHLAMYPQRLLELCGLDATAAAVVMPAGYADLFPAGKECRDDPEGTIYPAMSEIKDRFFSSYRHALESLLTAPDDLFARENPMEGRMKTMFPTLGGAANFLINSHIMMHMGQVSTWRRCFGLGPVM